MATIKPSTADVPPPKKDNKKTESIPATTSTPAVDAVKPIQFKIPAHMHQEIKLYAVENNISMTDLFMSMYKEYRKKHG